MQLENLKKFGIDEKIVKEYVDKVKNGEKIIAVTGTFSSGKSTFINAFIGKENFLAASNIECTPVLVDLINEESNEILVKYNDGREESVSLTEENIAFYTRDKESYDKDILGLTIPCKSEYLKEKFHFIDTPGTSTPKIEQELITNSILKKSDIVLYVFDTAVSQVDLDRIEFIKKYADQIIFIMTKMDERVDGEFKNLSKEKIDKLSQEAIIEINKVYENPSVLPISSKTAFKEPEMIVEIREIVSFIASRNSEKKFKENAKKQLSLIFEERLNAIKEELSVEEKVFYLDLNKLNKSEDQLKREIDNLIIDNDMAKKELENLIKNKTKKSDQNLSLIYENALKNINERIDSYNEITQDELDYEFNKISDYVNVEIKKYLDKTIEDIISTVYKENEKKIEEINTDLGISIEANIKKPTIKEVVLDDYDINSIKNKISTAEAEIAATQDVREFQESKIEEYKNKIQDNEEKENDIDNKILSRGAYIPQYDEVVENGYGDVGRKIGSYIGNAADIALIFAPGIGPLKAVDAAKDSVKVTEYGLKFLNGVAKTASKGAKKGQNHNVNKVVSILEMLSISKYTEELGEVIGQAIKPNRVLKVENEDYRRAWEEEENKLRELKLDLIRKESMLNNDLEDFKISVVEARQKTKKLEEEKRQAEEELAKLLEEKAKEKEKLTEEQIKSHYKNEIEKVLSYEFEELKPVVNEVLEQVSENTVTKSANSFNQKLEFLKESIENLTRGKEDKEKVLTEKKELLDELKKYSEWIDLWIA